MKRLSLAIMFVFCTLAMAAQDVIRVNYQGDKPTISDFITAYLAPTYGEDGECDSEAMNGIRNAWERHRKGLKQQEGDTFTLDVKNGFAVYEYKYFEGACEFMTRIEMCFWNEADGKHKLFAYNHMFYRDGQYYPGQYDGLTFMRYDNATKTMKYHSDAGVQAVYESKSPMREYRLFTSQNLPVSSVHLPCLVQAKIS